MLVREEAFSVFLTCDKTAVYQFATLVCPLCPYTCILLKPYLNRCFLSLSPFS